MKIFKFLFNRFSLVALTIVLTTAAVILSAIYFSSVFKWLNAVITVLSIIVYFSMLRKKQLPEFKITWLFLLVIAPILGIILYLFFSTNKPPKNKMKKIRFVQKTYSELNGNLKGLAKNKDFLGYEGTDNYLKTATNTNAYRGKAEYLSPGERFIERLKSDLKTAEKFIFLEYFIIEYGKVWDDIHAILTEKIKENVDVRVIYDDIGCASKVKINFAKKLNAEGIKCVKFNPFIPVISGLHNNRDHRKIAVIDGKVAYTGGCNLADEYANINSKLGHWKDSAIRITGNAVNNLTAFFMENFSAYSEKPEDVSPFIVENDETDADALIHTFADGPEPYFHELVGENNFLNMINSAKEKLYITTPYLIVDHTLSNALMLAAKRGVDVKIITPHLPDKKIIFEMTRVSYRDLLKSGVKIFEYTPGFMHAKHVLVDDKMAFFGTINFDYRSLVHHFECGAVVFGGSAVLDLSKDIEQTLILSEEQTLTTRKENIIKRGINLFLMTFRPLF